MNSFLFYKICVFFIRELPLFFIVIFLHGNGAFSWPRVGGGWFRPREWGFFMAERGWLVVPSTGMGRFHGRTWVVGGFVHGNGAFSWPNVGGW